jgi:hypothetical protein
LGLHGKSIRHRQGSKLICLQGYFLGQHDVARDEMARRYEAPTSYWPAAPVHLVDICRYPAMDAIPLAALAADYVEPAFGIELRALLGRKPLPKKHLAASFARAFTGPASVSLAEALQSAQRLRQNALDDASGASQ